MITIPFLTMLVRQQTTPVSSQPTTAVTSSAVLRQLQTINERLGLMATSAEIQTLQTSVNKFVADAFARIAGLEAQLTSAQAQIASLQAAPASLSADDVATVTTMTQQVNTADAQLAAPPTS